LTPGRGLASVPEPSSAVRAGGRRASQRIENNIRWITGAAQLRALVEGVDHGPLALDTEADSLHNYPDKVCLIQLHAGGAGYLIDPLAGFDLSPLAPLLGDPELPKILHGADYDLRVLHRDFGFEVRGLFDTMIAARLVGETSFGLAALLERHFGVGLDKRYQRADWARRPLPSAMARYAALDTLYLQPLAERLERELRRLGRKAWADEEFRRLEGVRWRDEPDPEAYRRIKGAAALGRRGLAALRELAARRESEARRRGRPPFKVLGNDALVRLAGALPEQDLPELRLRRRPRHGPGHDGRLRRLCRERDALAASLGLEPAVLAAKPVLEEVLLCLERGEQPGTVPDLRRWQAELLRPAFERLRG